MEKLFSDMYTFSNPTIPEVLWQTTGRIKISKRCLEDLF
jgi:hypothetical protein